MNTQETLTTWDITTNRYVGFIDIMGFKDMVTKLSHTDIYDLMKRIDNAKASNSTVGWNKQSPDLIKTVTFSDSIMIFSKDSSYNSLYSIVCTMSGLSNDLFENSIPHKGALALGLMTLDTDKSIFFGQPLIDAFLLQEEIHFYGLLIHGTAQKNVENANPLPFVDNYLCPLKNGSSFHLTIRPMHADSLTDEKYKSKAEKIFKSVSDFRYSTSGHLRKYIDNTETYLSNFKHKPS